MSDASYEEYRERMEEELAAMDTDVRVDTVAIDLIKRQPLYIEARVADDLVEYAMGDDGFDLSTYNQHPYMGGVSLDDAVFKCRFISTSPDGAHNVGNDYDYPEGRLMHVPLPYADPEPAVDDEDEDSVDEAEAVVRAAAEADEPADVDSGPGELGDFDAGGDSA